jgi:predicted amidohydrolase
VNTKRCQRREITPVSIIPEQYSNVAAIERIILDFPRPRTIRLLLPRAATETAFWRRHDGLSYPRDDKLFENQIASIVSTARRTAANAIILPELAVPESLVFRLQEWSAQSGGVAIAGSHYFKHDDRYVARCPVIIAGKVFFTEKVQPAPAELSPVVGRGLSPGKRLIVYSNTPIGTFSVLICSDFLVADIRTAILGNSLDILFVPAFQRNSTIYHSRMGIECEESETGVYIAYSNMAEINAADGSSAVFGVVDNLWASELVESRITDGVPNSKLCELSDSVEHIVVDLDIENRRPRVGRTVQSRPNFKVVEFSTGETTTANEFTRSIAHDDERYRRIADFFVPPAEYGDILKQLESDRLVFIVGDPGIGKTYTAAAILKLYFEKGYEPIWFTGIEREERQLQRQTLESYVPKPKQVIYFEDPFGRTSFERRDVLFTVFRPIIDQLSHIDARIIITSRREVFERFSHESLTMRELMAFSQNMGVVKPSYSESKLGEILRKLAEGRCKWFANPMLRPLAFNAITGKKLCTPWAIRDFVFASQAVCKKRELRDHIGNRSSENSLNFAHEVANSSPDDQLLFCLVYLLGTLGSAKLSLWHARVKENLKRRGLDLSFATFAEQLRTHLGFRIEQFGTARSGIRFTHPIYEEAVAQAATGSSATFAVMTEILHVVEMESIAIASHAASRISVKHPFLASRLFDMMAGDEAHLLVDEKTIVLGEKLVVAYRNTKLRAFLEALGRMVNPVALAKFINDKSPLGEIPRCLRLARNYQQLVGKSDIRVGNEIDWARIFDRLAAKPRLGPWGRVVEAALWFDQKIPVEFLSHLAPSVLRARFLGLPPDVRDRILSALKDTPLFERLSRMQGDPQARVADMSLRSVDLQPETLASGIVIDQGAIAAMKTKRCNLLPSGIVGTIGSFLEGELISVFAGDGSRVGIAFAEYSADEIDLIKGFHSAQIPEILGYARSAEVIYVRQYLVLAPE